MSDNLHLNCGQRGTFAPFASLKGKEKVKNKMLGDHDVPDEVWTDSTTIPADLKKTNLCLDPNIS